MLNHGHSLQNGGQLQAALDVYTDAKQPGLAVLGDKHLTTLAICDNLAALYSEMGRKKDALELCEWTLARKQVALGRGHRSTVASLVSLASIYKSSGRFADALPLQVEALDWYTKNTPNSPRIPDTMYNSKPSINTA